MKSLVHFAIAGLITTALTSTAKGEGEGEGIKSSPNQLVACKFKPEQYANNKFEFQPLAEFPIEIKDQSDISLVGRIKEQETKIDEVYSLRISGFVTRPGGAWVKGGTLMLVTATLLQRDNQGKILLSSHVESSDQVRNEKMLDERKNGQIATRHHLENTIYLNMRERNEKIDPTQLTSIELICEVVKK